MLVWDPHRRPQKGQQEGERRRDPQDGRRAFPWHRLRLHGFPNPPYLPNLIRQSQIPTPYFFLSLSKAFNQTVMEADVSFLPFFTFHQMKPLHVSRRPVFFLRTHTRSSLDSFPPGAQPLPTGRQFSDLSLQLTRPPLPGALQARGSKTHVQQPSPPSHESPGKSQPS